MPDLPRSALPIPDRKHVGLVTFDAKDPDTSYPPIETLLPPAGAPNVLIVLIDDVGFGAPRSAGRARHLAERPLRTASSSRAHTTALCSPRGPPRPVATITLSEWAASPRSPRRRRATTRCVRTRAHSARDAPAERILDCAARKCHEVPVEMSPMGPFDHWPRPGGGFEYFYGLPAATNQYYPVVRRHRPPTPKAPEEGYHLTEDIADRAITGCARRRHSWRTVHSSCTRSRGDARPITSPRRVRRQGRSTKDGTPPQETFARQSIE
jgi:arylsulfatase